MKEEFEKRLNELLHEGENLISSIPRDEYSSSYWIPDHRIAEYQKWMGSTTNLINLIDQPNGTFVISCNKLLQEKENKTGIPSSIFQKMFGILGSVQEEWKRGFLRKIEHIIIAEAYDDFLDHAEIYHKGNKKIESAVLASSVLEDTIKKISHKHGITTKKKSLEPLIEELVKEGIITPVKAKRIKGFSGVRNHALHAEWNEFDIKDVGQLISGIRELIENFL